jgi:hypothetical protein
MEASAMTEPYTQATYLAAAPTSAGTLKPHSAAATYRQLVTRGLDPTEAANLTAFLNGLAVGPQPWAISEVSNLLFLRELVRTGRFGRGDWEDR